MAHGFLTPQPVSGDRFWQNAKWLLDQLDKRLKDKKKEPQEKGGGLATTQKGGIIDESVQAVRVTDINTSKTQRNEPPAAKMLKQSAFAGALNAGTDSIVKKEQLALPPGGPRLPGGAAPAKGGTFTNIPGISAAPKKLDSEAFFKAAQTGVHPETGAYLSSEERKEYLKKSKAQMNATASVAAGGASAIDSSSTVTKGDEEIVGSIEKLTKVTTSLVDVVKKQTSTQKQSADKATAKAETIANRAKATEEEKALEQGTDNSSFITPSGGIGSPISGGGPGGGGLGLGTALGAAGKVIGKVAPGIGARGAARALPRAAAAVAGKGGAKALMKMGGKTAARLIPGAQTAIGLGLAGEALSRGDILGAALSAGSAIPGPLGWGFLAADVARDVSGGGKGMARGGLVTGGKKSVVDDVPIRADEGEVVMSNAAGNTWGRSTLLAMNAMGGGANKPTGGKGYAEGGLVGGDKAKSKQMFKLFGEGMIDAQKANSRDFAKIQSQGMKQYYENEGGFKKMGQGLKDFFSTLAGGIASLFGGSANAATGNPADYLNGGGDFSGSSGQAQAMNYFMSQGLTKEQAAGIVGNLMQESTAAIDPKAKNASGHRGIAQWDANRWKQFEEFAKKNNLDVNTREAQLQWIMQELKTGSGGLSLKTLKTAKTSRESGTMFLEKFERSGEKAGSAGFENRMRNAAKLAATKDFGSTAGAGGKGGKIIEYLTGDTSHRGYRSDHGGSNYHEHLAFATTEQRDLAMKVLRENGIQIGSINSGKHANGSYHYKNLAFDVPGAQVPVGQEPALSKKVRSILSRAGFGGQGITAAAPKVTPPVGSEPVGSEGTAQAPKDKSAVMRENAARLKAGKTAKPANQPTGQDVAAASAFYTSGMRNTRGGGNTTVIANSNNGTSGSGSSNSAGAASGSSGMGALSALRLRVQ
jgi:Phage tail lysozyme